MNPIAKFYQEFGSGKRKFSITTGRHFSVVFSFPHLANAAGTFVSNIRSFSFGDVARPAIESSLKLNPRIGLNFNITKRFTPEDIPLLIKNLNLPNLKIADGNEVTLTSDMGGGNYSIPGVGSIEPESNTFSINFIPTVESPIEGYFIPWMEEVMYSNVPSTTPFRRANVFVYVYNEANLGDYSDKNIQYTYILNGVYPNFCDTPNLSHETAMDSRSVGFKFNTMSVSADFTKGKEGLLSNVTAFAENFGVPEGVSNLLF